MKSAIRQRAVELGFDICRFTTAEPPATAAQFRHWLSARHHGEMAYLGRQAHKRADPQQVLPGAKSIVSLAVSYDGHRSSSAPAAPPSSRAPSGSGSPDGALVEPSTRPHSPWRPPQFTGVVARYARFTDYHGALGERLARLTAFVNQLGGGAARSLWYVDTGPLLERDLAQRAGIGFIGKHTNLISRELGNWFFLGEIITTVELEPDVSEKNRCGKCARCIAACPTRAIVAPFQLDARLCISYLTIELKGPIPHELRPAIGNRIFGCDDCLAACPWNRFAQQAKMMKGHSRADLSEPDLVELLSLDEPGFKRRFGDTPVWRTRRRGLLRNVCVALGNVGDASALPALDRAARDPEPLIAEHARWAIEQIQARPRHQSASGTSASSFSVQ